jgi:hypothetical protein
MKIRRLGRLVAQVAVLAAAWPEKARIIGEWVQTEARFQVE